MTIPPPPQAEISALAPEPLIKQLQDLTRELLFISESESSLEVVVLPAPTENMEDMLREDAQLDGEPVQEQELEDILGERADPPAGADDFDLKQAPKYEALLHMLSSQLRDAKAYRLGKQAPQTLYLIGKTFNGGWIGVKTTTVDT